MIDELAYAGPEHLDAAFVAGFDRKQGYPDPADDLDVFAAQGLGADSSVVDLGTGTGQFALAAARRFGHVTAVDVSPAMLELLRERAGRGAGQPGLRARGLPQLPARRAAGRRGLHPACPAPAARLLEGAGPGPDRADAAARRGAAAARPDLRLPPSRDRGRVPGLVPVRRGGPGRGLHRRGLRRAHPHRVQHLPLAARADARRGRLRDRGRGVRGRLYGAYTCIRC